MAIYLTKIMQSTIGIGKTLTLEEQVQLAATIEKFLIHTRSIVCTTKIK